MPSHNPFAGKPMIARENHSPPGGPLGRSTAPDLSTIHLHVGGIVAASAIGLALFYVAKFRMVVGIGG